MSTFFDKLKKNRTNIKESSLNTYIRNIRRLYKVYNKLPIPPSNSKWLNNKLLKWFDEQPLSVRRHLANAAIISLKVYKKDDDQWQKRHISAMKEFEENREKRELSDKQKTKIPNKGFDSLQKVVSQMKRELSHVLKKPSDEWTFNNMIRVQVMLILSLYINYPLRLDYADLKIGRVDGENCIYKRKKKSKGWHIQLTEFKTVKTEGPKTFKLNLANQRILNKFIPASERLTEHGFLLSNQNKNKMSKQVLSKTLMATTKKRIGKEFSVQLIRILFAMKNRDIIETAKEVSEKLLHSAKQTLAYAKKK